MKKIFVIDWFLVALFTITAISGFGMHISGSRCSHEVWHNWAVVHTLSSMAFLIAGVIHIQVHWGWYKGWFKKGLGNKSRVTVLLSIIFILSSITGVITLVAHEGSNSSIGMWHYRIGILLSVLAIGHILKRMSILRKSAKS